jgi:hypothetical protein
MQFGLIEMDGTPYTSAGKLTHVFIFCALIALFYFAITLLIRYRRLRRFSQLLGQPLLTMLESGKWEPAELSSWREVRDVNFLAIIEALRRELAGQGPISVSSAIIKGFNLLAGPFMRKAYHLQVLGWSTCLVGWFGFLGEIKYGFRGMAFLEGAPGLGPFATIFEYAIGLQLVGLLVGIACLWVSSFARSRLGFIQQDHSTRILAASIKRV